MERGREGVDGEAGGDFAVVVEIVVARRSVTESRRPRNPCCRYCMPSAAAQARIAGVGDVGRGLDTVMLKPAGRVDATATATGRRASQFAAGVQ